MNVGIVIVLVFFGAALGSFAAAQVWRLRARQLRADKKLKDPEFDAAEYRRLKPLLDSKLRDDRSRCLSCGHTLAWYDLIPIVSWLSLGGKCRYCRVSIGRFEIVMELGLAAFFAFSYIFWPYTLTTPLAIMQFVIWLAIGVVLATQCAYDAKWFLLLDSMNVVLAILGVLYVAAHFLQHTVSTHDVVSLVGALFIMSGIYGLLYIFSRGAWIGLGDVKLGVGLGLMLMTWSSAFVALFAANLIGCLVILPAMLGRKLTRTSHIPFGPFLIVGTVIGVLWGQAIVSWYLPFTAGFIL